MLLIMKTRLKNEIYICLKSRESRYVSVRSRNRKRKGKGPCNFVTWLSRVLEKR